MKKLFALSMTLNVLLLLAAGYAVQKLGGVGFAVSKVSAAISGKTSVSPYYLDRISLFETVDSEGGVVFLGDSITDGNEWREFFPNVNVKNRGINGDRTAGVLGRMNEIVKMKPQKVFIMIGTNDLGHGVQIPKIIDNYSNILKQLSGTHVYIESVLPVVESIDHSERTNEKIKELNHQLQNLSSKYQATYIDLFSVFVDAHGQLKSELTNDGLHISGDGYALWKERINEYVTN